MDRYGKGMGDKGVEGTRRGDVSETIYRIQLARISADRF
jgi:hypothetical protein